MNIADLLTEAANLMLIGMVVVFVFLGILIVCITAMANLVGKEEPEVFNTSPKNSANAPAQSGASSDVAPEVVAAISAAVHNYRNNHDK